MSYYLPLPRPPSSTLFPYTTLFRSIDLYHHEAQLRHALRVAVGRGESPAPHAADLRSGVDVIHDRILPGRVHVRSEEHTSELQSPVHLVCRILLEKKNKVYVNHVAV